MRRMFLFLLGLLLFVDVRGQEILKFSLKTEKIIIQGRTNINRFECKLELIFAPDSIEIELVKEESNFDFKGLSLKIPVKAFDCKHQMMTDDFRELLRYKEFPFLHFSIDQVEQNGGSQMNMDLELSVAGKMNEEQVQHSFINDNDRGLVLGGSHKIYLKSYDLEPPRKFFGVIVVRDELDIAFEMVLDKAK